MLIALSVVYAAFWITQQLNSSEYADIPYDTLSYTCGECNYGGKVTDGHDRHTIMTILADYYTPQIARDSYRFSSSIRA